VSFTRVPLVAALLVAAACAMPTRADAQFTGPCARGRPGTRVLVGGVFVGGNAALYEYFRRAWWSGEKVDFHVNNDWGMQFRDQDKLGHALGGYHLTRISSGLLRGACVGERKSMWWGAAYAAAFQLQIEIWDGMQDKYGFSPPDLLFNTAGAAYAVAQHEAPRLRAFKPTISYARTEALHRAPEGSELRPTVDYSGQTYWVSVDVDALLPPERKHLWPGILRVSLGRSITDWVDPATQRTQRAGNLLVLSLDLDPEKLPGDHPVWRQVKHQLSYYRFPAPAIVIGPGGGARAWYR
jgi:hypothetical protein